MRHDLPRNEFSDSAPGEDLQAAIDRLVDGELPAKQRRQLLASLDGTPGAWRACALAFVEAQTLREQLTALSADAAPAAAATPPAAAAYQLPPIAAAPAGRAGPAWWAVAASALLAFGIGSYAVQRGDQTPTAAGGAAANTGAVAGIDQQTGAEAASNAALAAGGGVNNGADDEALILWVSDEQGRRQSLRAPLVDAQTLRERFGLSFRSAVPPELRQQMEGSGYQLSSRRRYAPLYLDNGRPLVVPVEDVQIVPVRGTAL
ncbi:MAG: hypothetical protein AAF790_04945 [Planctomycetota bacterium]